MFISKCYPYQENLNGLVFTTHQETLPLPDNLSKA